MDKLLLVCGVSLWAIAGLRAQQPVEDSMALQKLDEVVVSDSRFALKRAHSGKTVIRIGATELERYQGRSVAELLSSKAGIEISGSRSRPGEVLGVYARGGRGRQVVVLIDGVRVTDPSSSSQEYDLRLLSTDQIATIEILKGASSTLYGTNAATAVISITTKKGGDQPFGLQVGSSLGTNQSANDQGYDLAAFTSSANMGGTLGAVNYTAGFSQTYSGHLSSLDLPGGEADPFSRYRADIRLGVHLKKTVYLSMYANKTHMHNAYDESFGQIDAPYEYFTDQRRAGASFMADYRQGELHANAGYTEFNSENRSAFPGVFRGRSLMAEAYNKYALGETLYFLSGISYVKDRATFEAPKAFTIVDPYVNLVYLSGFGLNINTGARWNNHSEYGDQWVYNVNPSFTLTTKEGYLKIMGTIATSYLTPSLTQLFGEFGANPNLKPETDRSLEAGMEWAGEGFFRASALYFNRKEAQYVFFDNSNYLYRNAEGTIDAQGVELDARLVPFQKTQLQANYTYTERKGDNAIRIPRHKINAELGLQLTPATYSSIQFGYTGARKDTDFTTFSDVELRPYSLFNLYISREMLSGRMKVFMEVENIFNAKYYEIMGFTTRGRNLRLGCHLSL